MSLSNNFPTIDPSLMLDFANTLSLDPRITFTRTTTAVYYNGVTTAKAEENLLTYSQAFSDGSGWVNSGSTDVAENTIVAPDGTTTAEGFLETATTAPHGYIKTGTNISLAAGTYTTSCWIKANGRTAATLILSRNANNVHVGAVFDLTGVAVTQTMDEGSGFTYLSSSITELPSGSGWYRCVLTGTVPAATDYFVGIYSSDATTYSPDTIGRNSFAGDVTKGLYLWGAQLEQRSAVTAYTPTTTQPITNYIPVLLTAAAGQARFDHNPTTGESLGLLVEEQRTNLVLQSENFSTTWGAANATVTTNTIIAPDGTLSGETLTDDATTGQHQVSQIIAVTSGTSYTLSCFVKQGTNQYARLSLGGTAMTFAAATFDLNAGTVLSGTATITPVGNGWYRISTTSAASSTGNGSFAIGLTNAAGTTYSGTGSTIYIWGAQLEAGAFPTSYIATTSASVTRNSDAVSMTGTNFSSWYRADEGTVYASGSPVLSGTNVLCAINDGTNNEAINIYWNSNLVQFQVRDGNATQAAITGGASLPFVVAGAYAANDFSAYVNGSSIGADTSGSLPSPEQLRIGNLTGGSFANGTIKKIAFYPSRLTNAQLQALTS